MKKVILSFVAILGITMFTNTANAQSKEQEAVKKVINNYFSALNSSDTNKVVSLYTTDGILFANGAPTATGTEQLKGTYQYVFNNFTYTLQVTIDEVVVSGNYAYARSTSKGSYVIKANGEKADDNFRELYVFRKVKGEWKMVNYMYNKSK